MQSISRKEVADIVGLEVLAELHQIREKTASFERKYGASYEQIESSRLEQDENFEVDDDLMEWKAYLRLKEDRQKRLEDFQHERFRVA
ncbi:MAG: hypothetical protein DRP64_02925 [Verrucomicrobia bacterium]|nr:MAG: hypothetical protein DRP64_02925 [Verrucomicrobiota bacterium]